MDDPTSTEGIASKPRHVRLLPLLALGLFGGLALGVTARGWMRLISDDPEFTWSGTIFIVAGFTVFGTTQALAAWALLNDKRRTTRTVVRIVAVVCMLPLFVAAGAVMFPTVMGAGLARARDDWPKALRIVFAVIAALPVVLVALQLHDDFGLSLHTATGMVGLAAIYTVITWATHFALEPQRDGWHLSRRSKVVAIAGTAVALGIPLAIGGIA